MPSHRPRRPLPVPPPRMSTQHPELLFPAWRQRCLDDALALVNSTLNLSGQDGQAGLQEAWRERLKALINLPGQSDGPQGTANDALSGPQLVSEDEIEEGVLSQHLVQALEAATGWVLTELQTRCGIWQRQAEQAGFEQALLLTPGLLAESLCLALRDCVPRAPRRHQLLRDLSLPLARQGKDMYERLGQWLETQGLENRGMVLSGVRSAPGDEPAPASAAMAIDPAQVPELLARVAEQAGLDSDMRQLMADLAGPIQRSLGADPSLLDSREHSIWRFVDRLAHLALVDRASPLPDETPLHVRLGPMVQAFRQVEGALSLAHYERALSHIERLAAACVNPPISLARANQAVMAAEQRRAELEPWLQTQLAERLQHQELLPRSREFLHGPWVQVVSRTAAVAGLTAPTTRQRTDFIEKLIAAADVGRVQSLSLAELDTLVEEARDGLRGIGCLPAVVDEQTEAVRRELRTRSYKLPSVATPPAVAAAEPAPASASPLAAAVFGQGEAANRDSSDWMSDDWAHHGDLDTVSMGLPDVGPPGSASPQSKSWLGSLKAGELCRVFLQGRWSTARLDWVSDRQQFYKFSCHGSVFNASRRMLLRMRAEGLITTIEPGQWLRDAVNSMPLDLDLV